MLVHNLMMNISHLLIATNSAVNIVVYSLKVNFCFNVITFLLDLIDADGLKGKYLNSQV